MTDERRRKLHDINSYLIPALFVAFLGIGGYIANRVFVVSDTVNVMWVNQMRVIKTLDNVEQTTRRNEDKLDYHIQESGLFDKFNSERHHRRDVFPCQKCHTK